MKVVQINATFVNGSTGGIVKDIQSQCLQADIDCYVAYSLSSIPKDNIVNGYQIGNILDHKIHAVLSRIGGRQGRYSRRATRSFLKWLGGIQPDVINIHNLHSNFINMPTLLKWIAHNNIPLVVTLHDCWYFTGGCPHFTSSNCSRWKNSCGDCPRKNKDIPYLFDCSAKILREKKRLFSQVHNLRVVGVSQWTADMAQQGIFKDSQCSFIYNGVDVDVFKPVKDKDAISAIRNKYGIKNRFVILGPASKWLMPENRKLFDSVLELGPEYTLVIYGCNEQQLNDEESVQVTLENKTQLVKIGYTRNQQELVELYNMANVFVNCTHEDTFSLINVEAQTCGTPVICYANTGAKETVNTQFGCLVETDDINSMVDAVTSLISDDSEKSCQEELSIWAASHYNKTVNYKQYIELYREICI